GSSFLRAGTASTGFTTKKKIAAATETNVIAALMKSPYLNVLPLIVNESAEKSCEPKIAAMIGVIRSATKAVTSAAKARPITMPTAMSIRFPRKRNALNSLRIERISNSFRQLANDLEIRGRPVVRTRERRLDEGPEERCGAGRSRLELGMELRGDEPRMVG